MGGGGYIANTSETPNEPGLEKQMWRPSGVGVQRGGGGWRGRNGTRRSNKEAKNNVRARIECERAEKCIFGAERAAEWTMSSVMSPLLLV